MQRRHTDSAFEAELSELCERLVLMAERAAVMVETAVSALVARDTVMARQTLALDARVNRDELELDEMCLLLLAKRQPMASDLRLIAVVLKLVTDIERIADLAKNVAERVLDLNAEPPVREMEDVAQMSALVLEIYRESIEAFATLDVTKARTVIERDDEIDEAYHTLFRSMLLQMVSDAATVERGIHVQSVAKYLERIGDHATNLAEHVIFVAEGLDVRHRGLASQEGGSDGQ
jgi:phosphate transport system protein